MKEARLNGELQQTESKVYTHDKSRIHLGKYLIVAAVFLLRNVT